MALPITALVIVFAWAMNLRNPFRRDDIVVDGGSWGDGCGKATVVGLLAFVALPLGFVGGVASWIFG